MAKNLSFKPRERFRAMIPYFVLGITLILSAGATYYVARATDAKDKLRFENGVQRTEDDIKERLETHIALLRASSGLLASSDSASTDKSVPINRKEFQAFIEQLELQSRFPGVQGIGFSLRVLPSQKEAIAADMVRQGIKDFTIRPQLKRSEYYPIVYIEPMDQRNKTAIGYDMYSELVRRAAMEKARDTGTASASGKVTLVQDFGQEQQAGFLIYVPVYRREMEPKTVAERRNALIGFVYSPFRADDLMAGIFGSEPNPIVDFQIYDGTELSPKHLLHSSNPNSASNNKPRFTETRTIAIAGRTWTIYFASRPDIDLASDINNIPYVAFGGLVISFILFAITRSQVKARYVAEQALASLSESEKALRESSLRLRRLVDANIIGILIGDIQGKIIEANDAFLNLIGYSHTQVTSGQANWLEITPPEYRHLDQWAIREMLQTGSHAPVEKEYVHSDGTRVPVLVGTAYLGGAENLCVGFILDLTQTKQIEAARRESDERLRYALEGADMVAWEWNPISDRAMQSQNASQVFGTDSGKGLKLGSEFFNLIHPDDRDYVVQLLQQAFTQKTNYSAEFRLIRPDGVIRWMADRGRVIYDTSGQPLYLSGVVQDITERRQAEEALRESEERFRQLADKVRFIPWEASAITSNFTYVGPQAADILGYPLESWYSDNFWVEHMHPEDRDWAYKYCAESAIVFDTYEFEYKMLAADGEVVWLYDLVSVVREQNQPKVLRGVMIDITERKRVEAERLQLLQSEQAARETAEAANRMKDEFLATLSHELRTPLNAMLGWTSLLRTRKFDEATTVRALETIDRNTKLLTQLIEDLLDVSRIMTGKIHLEMRPVELAPVINAAIEAVQPTATAKDITINRIFQPLTSQVFGDSTRLQQIFWNLISNAIKFTPKGGYVEVYLEQKKSNAQITIKDNGQGISPEFLPHIFERFRQADGSMTRSHGGLGLGLAIVRNLVELHAGSIRAESKGKGQGAKFVVELSLLASGAEEWGSGGVGEVGKVGEDKGDKGDKEDKGDLVQNPKFFTSQQSLVNSHPLSNLWILVVDDEADVRELLTMVLQDNGAKVTAVASANAALQLICDGFSNKKPDILISDIGMPDEDGYSLIGKVRALSPQQGGNIPAIALTAYARREDKERSLHAGFQIHLAKPVIPEQLITLVQDLSKQIG